MTKFNFNYLHLKSLYNQNIAARTLNKPGKIFPGNH